MRICMGWSWKNRILMTRTAHFWAGIVKPISPMPWGIRRNSTSTRGIPGQGVGHPVRMCGGRHLLGPVVPGNRSVPGVDGSWNTDVPHGHRYGRHHRVQCRRALADGHAGARSRQHHAGGGLKPNRHGAREGFWTDILRIFLHYGPYESPGVKSWIGNSCN